MQEKANISKDKMLHGARSFVIILQINRYATREAHVSEAHQILNIKKSFDIDHILPSSHTRSISFNDAEIALQWHRSNQILNSLLSVS